METLSSDPESRIPLPWSVASQEQRERQPQLLSASLLEGERESFSYEPRGIDWWDYWINIHVPALRKWVYPLIEGTAVESTQRREFRLPEPAAASDAHSTGASGTEATWPHS